MGSVTALGIRESVLDLETQILYHLKGNHYPPVPAEMVAPCIEAIDAFYDEDFDRMIGMPKVGDFQILYKGQTWAPAHAIVDQHHLDVFIDSAEDLGTCDSCNDSYELGSREGRCGDCGDCSNCCVHSQDFSDDFPLSLEYNEE